MTLIDKERLLARLRDENYYNDQDTEPGLSSAIYTIEHFPTAKDLLSEELEGLPKGQRYTLDCRDDGSYLVFYTRLSLSEEGRRIQCFIKGKTPLSAILALKEALKSKP